MGEFRASSPIMRFTADRTPNGASIIESTRVWHDYDGDEIYGDLRLDFDGALQGFTEAEIASHEPGIGSRDWTASAGSQTTYRHGDQIGSTRAISNQPTSGDPAVTGRIVYTAFGERVWSDGAVGTRYQYAGAWGYQSFPPYAGASEDELPFIHVGHRWYDPSTGRFLQRDPIGIAGGLNLHSYVHNSPLALVDPKGLDGAEYRFRQYIEKPILEGCPEKAWENARAQAIGTAAGVGLLVGWYAKPVLLLPIGGIGGCWTCATGPIGATTGSDAIDDTINSFLGAVGISSACRALYILTFFGN